MAQSPWEAAKLCILVAAYLGLNTALNLMNRWALGIYGFSFPILLTLGHMSFAFLFLSPCMLMPSLRKEHAATLRRQWKGLVCIGCFMAMNIALNNLSLVFISLSLNQVIRASLPVVTAVVAVGVERKVPSWGEAFSLVLLTLGIAIAVFEGKAGGNAHGIMLCIMSTLCAAAMMTTSSKVLSEKIDALPLTFYTTPVSCTFLLPFFVTRELDRIGAYMEDHSAAVLGIILVGSAAALAYNVVHYLLIQQTSAVTVTVLGEVKIVALLALSAYLLPGERSAFTAKMTLGCVLSMAGFCLYSHHRLAHLRRRMAEEAATAVPSAGTAAEDAPLLQMTSQADVVAPGSPKTPGRQHAHPALAARTTPSPSSRPAGAAALQGAPMATIQAFSPTAKGAGGTLSATTPRKLNQAQALRA